MKKILVLLGLCSIGYANAQTGKVGINTAQPQATLDVKEKALSSLPQGASQGVSYPNFTTEERATFTNVVEGTMIYNTTKECVEQYTFKNNTLDWHCMCYCDEDDNTDEVVLADLYEIPNEIFLNINYVSEGGTCYAATGRVVTSPISSTIRYAARKLGKYSEKRYSITRTSYDYDDPDKEVDHNTFTLVIPAGEITEQFGEIPAYIEIDGDGEFLVYPKTLREPLIFKDISIGGQKIDVEIKFSVSMAC